MTRSPNDPMFLARFAIALNPYRRDNRYFRYMEAWHLLRAGTSSKSPDHPIAR